MGRVSSGSVAATEPTVAPAALGIGGSDRWRTFDNSVSAVSFGFVATAILISMFLVMAIFERFLWRRSPDAAADGGGGGGGVVGGKLDSLPSPKMTVYPKGVSVLMPGDTIPTFLAHPAPAVVGPPQSTSENAPRPIIIHQSTLLGPGSSQ